MEDDGYGLRSLDLRCLTDNQFKASKNRLYTGWHLRETSSLDHLLDFLKIGSYYLMLPSVSKGAYC